VAARRTGQATAGARDLVPCLPLLYVVNASFRTFVPAIDCLAGGSPGGGTVWRAWQFAAWRAERGAFAPNTGEGLLSDDPGCYHEVDEREIVVTCDPTGPPTGQITLLLQRVRVGDKAAVDGSFEVFQPEPR